MESGTSSSGEKTRVYLRTDEPEVRLGLAFSFNRTWAWERDLPNIQAARHQLQYVHKPTLSWILYV